MEKFKSLEELTKMDEKHWLQGKISDFVPDLKKMHEVLSRERLNEEVPNEIKGQFNVARNMALYTYFLYALTPEVQLKTYTIIEYALTLKEGSSEHLMLGKLLRLAVKRGWISDAGFRHIENPSVSSEWCKSLQQNMRSLRNSQAHGTPLLIGDCLQHIQICADFVNQLFPSRSDK